MIEGKSRNIVAKCILKSTTKTETIRGITLTIVYIDEFISIDDRRKLIQARWDKIKLERSLPKKEEVKENKKIKI